MKKILFIIIIVIVALFGGAMSAYGGPSIATAKDKYQDFEATIGPGQFAIFEFGNPFSVGTWAMGNAVEFGSFSFSAVGQYDDSKTPVDCPIGSSFGVQGKTALVFKEGILLLEMKKAQACLANDYTEISLVEEYKIVGGTGKFDEAEGSLKIELIGSLSDFTLNEERSKVSGSIKLND